MITSLTFLEIQKMSLLGVFKLINAIEEERKLRQSHRCKMALAPFW